MTVLSAMRFSEVNERDIELLIQCDDFVFEQKMDGTRVLAVISRWGIEFLQSSGKPLTHSAAVKSLSYWGKALTPLQKIAKDEIVLDGELLIRTKIFHVFDVPQADTSLGYLRTNTPFSARRRFLEQVVEPRLLGRAVVVPQAVGAVAKRNLFEATRRAGAEGVIAKHLDAPYESGKRVKHTVKIKFVKTADVIVTAVNRPDAKHGSFTFGVASPWGWTTGNDGEGANDVLVGEGDSALMVQELGKCSAIGKPNAQVGDVIEVAYLYREPYSGGVVQPRMIRIREDKTPAECLLDQFPDYTREPVHWNREEGNNE